MSIKKPKLKINTKLPKDSPADIYAKELLNKSDIQVMMLGARRVGKTSVLASMINEFNAVTETTNLSLSKEGGAKAVDDALNTMKGYFFDEHKIKETLFLDSNATRGFDRFGLRLDILNLNKKNKKTRKISFLDCAGEWINNYENTEKIATEVKNSTIIIVAIDSILLMEKEGRFQHQNNAENVTNFIKQNMNAEIDHKNRMVLFVPLKCEKYYHQNQDSKSIYYGKRMKTLLERIKEEYSDLLGFLTKPANKPYYTVAVLPILTLGGIEFFDFTDEVTSKTREITPEMIQYCYCEPNKFMPENCAQPLLYALMFEQKKIEKDYNRKAFKGQNKKRLSATIIEWVQDKNHVVKDMDYILEIKKLEPLLIKSGNGYEVIQDPLGL